MSKNLTTLHKKLDRLTERLGALDTRTTTEQRRADAHLRLMAQSVNILAKIATESREEARQTARDIAYLVDEALKASRESAERTAQISAEIRRH